MTDNFGSGVSRVLLADETAYQLAIWQEGKPPTDAALNLMQQLAGRSVQAALLRDMPSGFLGNETNPQADFLTSSIWSNWFKFGPQRTGEQKSIMWANVNGWLIPVTGTRTGTPPGSPDDTDTTNVIALDPPPENSGDFRIDFAFLEVWKARIQPDPSTTNKPSASAIYKYGNVEGGYSFLSDDLIDPALGFETEQRVQIQYRIRVVKGLVGLTTNPDGFDPVVVKAQGAASAPTAYVFENMRETLGDPGLWRAGDGSQNDLGTVDGYSYAVPICVVFRRNTVVWNGTPSQNLNGSFDRNPTAVDRTGVATFSTVPTLDAAMTDSDTSATLVSATDIPLPTTPATAVTIKINDEIMTYTSITGTTISGITRGANGTLAEAHTAGSVITVVSGRPDGLYADQVANTDILDLRHLVNPNGMDYTALLRNNLDKLLRGQLRANWKRTGAGPQGSFVHYQDAIQSAAVSLGVTQLDAPDNIRMVFSDAATLQPIECVVEPSTGIVPPGPGVDIDVNWSLGLTVQTINQQAANAFQSGDIIVIPVNQLKTGFQAGATDQVRWLYDSLSGSVSLRLDGETGDLPPSMYTVTPAVPGPNDDLTITLGPDFPTQTTTTAAPTYLHIKVHAVYGPGRGLSRRPDSLHSISYLNPGADILTQQWGAPSSNLGARVAWAPLWSKYRSATFNNLLPVTSEMYADLGSKTVLVTPFRRLDFTGPLTVDGDAANPVPTAKKTSATGVTNGLNDPILNDGSGTAPAAGGDALVIPSGPGAGRYTILSVAPTAYTLDRPIRAQAGVAVSYTVHDAQGVMPLFEPDGVTPKWATTDPLGLFCGETHSIATQKNIYVSLPRHLMPGWGEVQVPIRTVGTTTFASGIDFMIRSLPGTPTAEQFTYAAYFNGNAGGTREYSIFSQVDNASTPIPYNTIGTGIGGNDWCGIRFFTDTRGYDREGLEFPPFYGVARIFGVYEASDYTTNDSPFTLQRDTGGTGTAVNLLRQSVPQSDGPPLWVEIDDDGDSTFILNANAIDITKSPVPIADFQSGEYVVEAVIFGFDRGSFDLDSEFRLVMTRPGNLNGWNLVGDGTDPQTNPNREDNINKVVPLPTCVLPGPAEQSDQILINYSRTPYQGDAWGSQTSYIDIPYAPGPLTSGTAYEIDSTDLDYDTLTRPNEKVLEILASVGFSTTLGTGRYSGDASYAALPGELGTFTNVAYEDPTVYPPSTAIADRPKSLPKNFVSGDALNIGTEYLGCSERLPLGALWRDKDFRGKIHSSLMPATLVLEDVVGSGSSTGLAADSQIEQDEVNLSTASSGIGDPGDVLVHVDGEQGNYSLLTNFRVLRGGSVFTASGPHPGGSVSLQNAMSNVVSTNVNAIQGRAMLVRNTVTNVGSNEVSAGDELMLLVITNVTRPPSVANDPSTILIGTNGDGEGYSAADLYRIEGHPMVSNNVKMLIDPSTIQLARKV